MLLRPSLTRVSIVSLYLSRPFGTSTLTNTMAQFSPDKKCCIVVGLGKGGIGDSLAKKFSAEGYNVAMVARSDLTKLEGKIPNSKSYRCDAGDPEQVSKTVASIKSDMGSEKIDALMYNVGSGVFKPFENTSYEEFELSWRVGPAGVFLWTKACLSSMGPGCSIGLTGATASWRGMTYTPAFASSKMATRGLAQALARDLGPSKGIHVFHVGKWCTTTHRTIFLFYLCISLYFANKHLYSKCIFQVIDGLVDLDPAARKAEGKKGDNAVLSPDLIANTYWQLHQQPANCWTQETHLAAQEAFGSIASI